MTTNICYRHLQLSILLHGMFVDFPDAPAKENPRTLFDHYMPRAAAWYNSSSYGRLQLSVTPHLTKFVRMPTNSTGYGWTRNVVGLKMNQYIRDAVKAVGSSNPFGGNIDALYLVPTRAASSIWFSPTFLGSMRFPDGSVPSGAVTFGQDAFSGFVSFCSHLQFYPPTHNSLESDKILNHETTHLFGLPDLYPQDTYTL
jgi:M6 family metalloprotease-like protein